MAVSWLLLFASAALIGMAIAGPARARIWAPRALLVAAGLLMLCLLEMWQSPARAPGIPLLVVPLAALAAVVAFFRRIQGRGGLAIPMAAMAFLVLLAASWMSARRRVEYNTPAAVALMESPHDFAGARPQMTIAAPPHVEFYSNAPVDELWQKLNQPRIQLHETTSSETEQAAPAEHQGVDFAAVEDARPGSASVVDHDSQLPAVTTAAAIEDAGVTVNESQSLAPARVSEAPVVESPATTEADQSNVAASDGETSGAAEPRAPLMLAHEEPKKPDWIVNPPKLVGEVRRVVVQAGPFATLSECHDKLQEEMSAAVLRRIEELVREAHGHSYYVPHWLGAMRLGNDYVTRELLTDEYVESGLKSFGEMTTAWGLLEFTPEQDRRLLEAWQAFARREGVGVTIGVSAMVLSVLGLAYGLIKVDTWTRGYYSKRLFLGVPGAIIAAVLLLAMLNA